METRAGHSHASVPNQKFLKWIDETLESERAQTLVELELRHRVLLGHIEEHLGLGTIGSPTEPAAELAAELQGGVGRGERNEAAGEKKEEGDSTKPLKKGLTGGMLGSHRPAGRPQNLRQLVMHAGFEAVFAALIIMNSVVTALEVQYVGLDIGYNIGFPESEPAADTWPNAGPVLEAIQTFFGICFLMELLAKIVGLGWNFFRDTWNWFDGIIVFFWILDKIGFSLAVDALILRLMRLGRVVRIFRLMKVVHGLDSLHLLVSSMQASIPILIWASSMLTLIMMICAVILNSLLHSAMEEEPGMTDDQVETKQQLYVYFGTFSRSMLSMFEITLGNWIPICRKIVNDVHEGYSVMFIAYKCVVSFAVVKVITGVFLQETFKVATSDDEILIMQREKARSKLSSKMHALFAECDEGGDGTVSWEEFREIIEDPRVRTWLSAMELDVRDARDLFILLDDGDHQISADELVKGVSRLKGPSRALDMALLRKLCTEQAKEGEETREQMMIEGRLRDTAINVLTAEVRKTRQMITDFQAQSKEPSKPQPLLSHPTTQHLESAHVYSERRDPVLSPLSGAAHPAQESWTSSARSAASQDVMFAMASAQRSDTSRLERQRFESINSAPKLRTGPPMLLWHPDM